MGRKIYGLKGFDGGLNTQAQPFLLDDSASPDCANVYPDNFGALATRYGINAWTQVNKSGITITDIYKWRRDSGTETPVAFGGGGMWTYSGVSWNSVPSAMGVFNSGFARVQCFAYADVLYMRDGSVQYKFDGSNFNRLGVSAPSGVLSANCQAAGTLTGSYLWGYTYKNLQGVEGNLNSAMTTPLLLASGAASIGGFQTAAVSYGIQGLRLYRTKANTTTPYYFVVSMATNTSSIVDTATDGSLTVQAPTDNFPPPQSALIGVPHKDRIFYGVVPPGGASASQSGIVDQVWYTPVATPEIASSTAYFRMGRDGEPVFNIAATSDQLVVGKLQSVWELHIEDPGDTNSWFPRKIASEYGGEAPYFAPVYQDNVMLLSRWGFIAINLQGQIPATLKLAQQVAQSKLISKEIWDYRQALSGSAPSNPSQLQMNPSNQLTAAGINFGGAVWIAVATQNSTVNNAVWYFSYVRRPRAAGNVAWFRMSNMNFSSFMVYNNNLYAATSGTDGWIYQLENFGQYGDNIQSGPASGGSIQCVAIDSYYKTKYLGGKDDEMWNQKELRKLDLIVSAMTGTSINLQYSADGRTDNTGSINVSQDPSIDPYGNSTTNQGNTRNALVKPSINVAGRFFQFQISNRTRGGSAVTDTGFKLFRLDMLYDTRGRR